MCGVSNQELLLLESVKCSLQASAAKVHGTSGQDRYEVIEDWDLGPRCLETDSEVGYMKQRAAIFSNWKATVDGQEVETAAPVFYTNRGHVRGLTDARMMGERAFYVSTGGWKYDMPYQP